MPECPKARMPECPKARKPENPNPRKPVVLKSCGPDNLSQDVPVLITTKLCFRRGSRRLIFQRSNSQGSTVKHSTLSGQTFNSQRPIISTIFRILIPDSGKTRIKRLIYNYHLLGIFPSLSLENTIVGR